MRALDTRELASLALSKCCPFCRGDRFFEGPHGGISINWYCANPRCGAGFNLPPFPAGFGQLIASPGESNARAMVAQMIEAADQAIAALEAAQPARHSPEGELLHGLRVARDRYQAGARPLRFGPRPGELQHPDTIP